MVVPGIPVLFMYIFEYLLTLVKYIKFQIEIIKCRFVMKNKGVGVVATQYIFQIVHTRVDRSMYAQKFTQPLITRWNSARGYLHGPLQHTTGLEPGKFFQIFLPGKK